MLNKIRAPTSRPPDGRSLTRLRTAVTVFFALDGFIFAGWVVRIPAVKAQTHASASALGLALLGVSAGAVVTMMVAGQLCRRFGNHPTAAVCSVLLSLSVTLPPLAHSAPALAGVLLVFGAAYGGLNVAMNSAAVDVVAALRRPVMPGFHAAFSLGGMLGSGVGGLVAGHLTATRHLCALAATGLLVTAIAGRTLLRHAAPVPAKAVADAAPGVGRETERAATPDAARGTAAVHRAGEASAGPIGDDSEPGATEPTRPRGEPAHTLTAPGSPRPARDSDRNSAPPPHSEEPASRRLDNATRGLVIVFGLIALCTAYGEGALADWGALHLQQDLATDAGVAATGYGAFALAMTVGRMTGTTLLERLGRTRTLVAGGTTAALGMLLGSLAPSLWAALLGFGITGIGLANIFPVAMDRAGALAGPSGVAAAATLGYAGMLLGPPAIGFMADWFSLPAALTSVAALAAAAAIIGYLTRRAAPA
jgi:MFS family permease